MFAVCTVPSGAKVTATSTTMVSAPFLPGSIYQQPAICDRTASSSLAVKLWPIGAEGAAEGCCWSGCGRSGRVWAGCGCGGVGGAGGGDAVASCGCGGVCEVCGGAGGVGGVGV